MGQPDAPTWELLGHQDTASFLEKTETPLPHPKRWCNFIHPMQLSPFPERLVLPFPSGELLSGYEDVVSCGQDRYTVWVQTDPDVTLERHMVDVHKAVAQLESRASTQQRRRNWKINCRRMARYHLAGGDWLCGLWTPQQTGSMLLTTEVARCFSTKTPSSLKSKSSPFTFTIPDANCLISWWKVARDGLCKECSHVPPFVDLLSAARKHLQLFHSHFESNHFLFERAAVFFPFHELFWFCLVQVSTTQFCSFASFLMARVSDGSPVPASSSNMGSPNGSLPDLEGTGYRARTMGGENQRKFTYSYCSSCKTRLGLKKLRPDAYSDSGRPDD